MAGNDPFAIWQAWTSAAKNLAVEEFFAFKNADYSFSGIMNGLDALGPADIGKTVVVGSVLTAKGIVRSVSSLGQIMGRAPRALKAAKGATETVDLYRAVGTREFESVMTNKAFLPGGNSLEGRQFAMTMDEALTYANADPGKVAILRATIQKDALSAFDFSKNIDPFIFKNGVVTVQPGVQSEIFHSSLLSIEHAF